jgi:hypothetical protein
MSLIMASMKVIIESIDSGKEIAKIGLIREKR